MDTGKIQGVKKVYFSCSISGGRDHAHVHQDIIAYIKATGAHVLSELFADSSLAAHIGTTPDLSAQETWQRDVDWLQEADAIIAEVTQPSFGVGYEIAKAEDLGKPILILFFAESGRRLSPMLRGNPKLKLFEYSDIKQSKNIIKDFLNNT